MSGDRPDAERGLEPERDCPLCPRLVAFRGESRAKHPDWHNGPVPSFGALEARLLIVGLAPGLRGANRTGRPFTGDFAGELLFETLEAFGLAAGTYGRVASDGLRLVDSRLTNAVRCVPPANKPKPEEFARCLPFLAREMALCPKVAVILALGGWAWETVLRALEIPRPWPRFSHGAEATIGRHVLIGSYHVSQQNTFTGRLTPDMLDTVLARARTLPGSARWAGPRHSPETDRRPDPARWRSIVSAMLGRASLLAAAPFWSA